MNDTESTPVANTPGSPANSEANTQPKSGTNQPAPKLDANGGGQSVKERLEIGGKSLLGLAGLCYVLGLVVVTIHLRRYGLNSLTLSQLHYVTAGVWVLLPGLGMMSFVAAAKFIISAQDWKKKPEEPRWPKIFAVVMVLWLVSFGFYLGATKLLKLGLDIQLNVFSLNGALNLLVVPLLGALAFYGVAFFIHGLIVNPETLMKAGSPRFRLAGVWFSAIVIFFLIALYITLFAIFTYPQIPWSTGGGGSSKVELVVAAEAKPYLESVGVKFSPNQNRTESLRLLLATDNDFVILNSDGKAVSVPSDSVKSVLYEK